MTMLAEIGENARFFALLLEAFERALKVLVVMNNDFRQNLLPPFVAFVAPDMDRLLNLACSGLRRQAIGWVEVSLGASYPGGQSRWRPASTWTCRWETDWPPSGPVLITVRYPLSA